MFAYCASTAAFAANPACDAQAAEKKLAGAAKTSFVKKCEKDAAEAATKTVTKRPARTQKTASGTGTPPKPTESRSPKEIDVGY